MKIVLIGGSGFLGYHLVQALGAEGHHCVVLTRCPQLHRQFQLIRNVQLRQADVYSVDALVEHFTGADAVISMAGILNEKGFGGKGFERVHVHLVEQIIAACQRANVQRLLHVSAMNAGNGRSHYLVTKGQAEALLGSAQHLSTTIFRPSVIFGPGDSFLNRFSALLKISPVMPLACPRARMQPVYVRDVAAAMCAALGDRSTHGRSYELVGSRVYTLKELVSLVARVTGRRCWIIGLPDVLSQLQGRLLGLVPGKPFSYDNYLSLQADDICNRNGLNYFGIQPASLEALAPGLLLASSRQRRLQACRERAGRD